MKAVKFDELDERVESIYENVSENLSAFNIDLQWFAAEDEGRTEEPSEHKIRKAREDEGRVAKSQELISALGLLFPALVILFLAPYMLRTCAEMLRFFLLRSMELDPTQDRIIVGAAFMYYIRLILPIIIVAVIAALFSNIIQVGYLFTTKPLIPKFSKVVPKFGRYFQRTLFSAEAVYNLFKSIFKVGLIGTIAFLMIRSRIELLANLQTVNLWTSVTIIAGLAIRMIILTSLLLLILSIPDYMFQRWQYRQSLKMSMQEVKQERKDLDGDPLVKSRLRRRMNEIMSRDMLRNVPEADVVIVNPTHFAVALLYDPEKMPGPQVIARGEDQTALMIRRIAEQNGVPVVENKPVARALYDATRLGEIVPDEFFEVLAPIFISVMKVNEERRKAKANRL